MSDLEVCNRHGLSARMTTMEVYGKCPVCQEEEIIRLRAELAAAREMITDLEVAADNSLIFIQSQYRSSLQQRVNDARAFLERTAQKKEPLLNGSVTGRIRPNRAIRL